MAMDFWAAQRRARSKTTLYLTLFVILTLVIAAAAEVAMRTLAGDHYNPPYPLIGLIFLGITFTTAGFNYLMYSQYGGSYVAESVGGYRIPPNAQNPKERQLLNIVEEMALAAGVPTPPLYLIDAESINAFAAGITPQNAVIAITVGAVEKLNRDELQGVIAHEFGHIYNGDMKISMRLAAMLMGFFIVLYIGLRINQWAFFASDRRDDRRGGGGGNVVALASIILLIAGAVTWFFGSILKACVSREREYLADACSVQFTRNPTGIASALRKIAQENIADMPKEGNAYSHLYLDDRAGFSSLFATHPPIKKRIEAIEGRTYMPDEWKNGADTP